MLTQKPVKGIFYEILGERGKNNFHPEKSDEV